MIALQPPYLHLNGLTVFGDNADPLQWHYWPSRLALTVGSDGKPSFGLTKYRKDPTTLPPGAEAGGGFLSFGVGLGVGQDALASAVQAIRQQFKLTQSPRLGPIIARSGTVRLIFLEVAQPQSGAGAATSSPSSASAAASSPSGGSAATATAPAVVQRRVESASYAATPSLTGDETAAFSLSLNMAGATMMDNMIRAGAGSLTGVGSLVGVVYDIICDATQPPLTVAITAAWDQVNDRLNRQFGGAAGHQPVVTIDEVDDAIDQLVEDRVIRFAPIPAVGIGAGASSNDSARALIWAKRFVRDTFFNASLAAPKPVSPPTPVASPVVGPEEPYAPAYSFKSVNADVLKGLDAAVNQQGPFQAHLTAQATLSELIAPYPRESLITEVDLSDPFFQTVKVDVMLDSNLAADRIAAVEVRLTYKDQEHLCLLNDANRSCTVQWILDPALGRTYSFSCNVLFEDAPAIASAILQSNDSVLVINPHDLYTQQTTLVRSGNFFYDRYPRVDVELAYGDQPDAFVQRGVVTLTQAHQSGSWSIRLGKTQKAGYQYRLTFYPTSSAPIVGTWTPATTQLLLVNDPPG
jgi:hypothetical protein